MPTFKPIRYISNEPSHCHTLGLGVFDGIHCGHQNIIDQCDTILSFHPHPDIVLRKNSDLKYLTNATEREYLCPKMCILEFNDTIAKMTALDFLDSIVKPIQPKTIVVGYDFRFGAKRQGCIQLLREWGSQYDINCIEVQPITHTDDTIIKSSLIREQLQSDPDHAIQLLGHPYIIQETVIRGDGRGKTLGYPTANIKIDPQKAYPKAGVYYGQVIHQKTRYNAAIYIGNRQTFDKKDQSCEVHLFDLKKDLYNDLLTIEIHGYIRPDLKFESPEELTQQIEKDILTIQTKCQTLDSVVHDAVAPDQSHQSHP